MSEPWMKSAMDVIWSLPNMVLTKEKTRSDAAEEGAIAKMMRAAFAHACAHVGVHQCCCMCQQSGRLFFKLFSVDFQFEILDEILLL